MRIRKPFAGAFVALIFISAAAGFSPPDYKIPSYKQSDKALHFTAFFLLTLCFYWILETSRRKVVQLTFTVCTLGLGLASEVIQGLLPVSPSRVHSRLSKSPRTTTSQQATSKTVKRTRFQAMLTRIQIHRDFDYYDIVANVLGSLLALGLCNWYHKRMLERKRAARGYTAVAGDEERDIELGETVDGQESGIVRPTVEEELDQWDENAEDWETTEPEPASGRKSLDDDGKKRND